MHACLLQMFKSVSKFEYEQVSVNWSITQVLRMSLVSVMFSIRQDYINTLDQS